MEEVYWTDKAALLDPAAYEIYRGATFNFTVPAGEAWYMVNGWNCRASGGSRYDHRTLHVDSALLLPSGTYVESTGNAGALALICKPSLVSNRSAYDEPKSLYYARLNRLRSLPLYEASATVPAASAPGTTVTTVLPLDFTNGMMAHVSCFDLSWVILGHNVNGSAANTFFEISDAHQQRVAEVCLVPFQRAVINQIAVASASVSGNNADVSLEGRGVVKYYKLPVGW